MNKKYYPKRINVNLCKFLGLIREKGLPKPFGSLRDGWAFAIGLEWTDGQWKWLDGRIPGNLEWSSVNRQHIATGNVAPCIESNTNAGANDLTFEGVYPKGNGSPVPLCEYAC
jgi:hypothetical protein